jgi:hypothetical protein
LESEIDISEGGEPGEECGDVGEIGVGGVSGDDGSIFNNGEFSGVRGDGEREPGSDISVSIKSLLADEVVDKEADSTVCNVEAAGES